MNILFRALPALSFFAFIGMQATFAAPDDHSGHAHALQTSDINDSVTAIPSNSVFVCPMHPNIVRGEEGTCPICGMALVEKVVKASGSKYPAVTINSNVQQNMGVRTATAKKGTMWQYINTLGRVAYNEEKAFHIHPRANGWIRKLNIKYEGQAVKKGEILYYVYSPEIVAAQKELLLAMNHKGSDKTRMITSAEERLLLLDVHPSTIKQIKHSKRSMLETPYHAPANGIVLSLTVKEGMYIQPDTEMFSIVDLSTVWLFADVYVDQLSWFKQNDQAVFRLDSYPDKKWAGKVDYIYPRVNVENNTATVRLVFSNKKQLLIPNMFGNVEIFGGPREDILIIPEEAVIPFANGQRVVKQVKQADGKYTFMPVDIEVGMRRKGYIEVLSGLENGDIVVSSGQFLIDSESQLNASFLRLGDDSSKPAVNQHNHH